MLPISSLVDAYATPLLPEHPALQAAMGVVALVTTVRVLGFAFRKLTKSAPAGRDPPFPKSTLPVIDNTRDLIRNEQRLYDWLTDLCLEFHGQPFRIEAYGLAQTVMLSSPDHIEEVLKTHFDNFEKGQFISEVLSDLLGKGIFASDGETWLHQRKTASHLFTMRALRDTMTSIVHKHLVDLTHALDGAAGDAIDLSKQLHNFTLDAFTDMAFGVDLSGGSDEDDARKHQFQAAFDAALRQLSFRMNVPRGLWKFQRYWNLAGEAKLKQDIKTIHNTALDVIARSLEQRREAGAHANDPPNLVSLFLDSFHNERDAAAVDATYLRDIVLNIMIAGRDTTAQALSWFFHCVDEHPAVAQKILDEIASNTPELLDPSAPLASMEQVAKLRYLDAAIKETLRLFPSVPLNIRSTVRDTVLSDGTLIRKGSLVGFPNYSLGRLPHLWGPDAPAYNPDRWFDRATGKPLHVSPFQFVAFHGGPRQCLGQSLAMLEMKIVVASLLTRFRFAVEPGQRVTYGRSLTLPMKHPFLVKVHPRSNGAAQ